jgi:hypothetical protein
MNDQVAMLVRYALIMGGSYLAGRGGLPADQVGPLVDQAIQLGGGLTALGSTVWGLYVKWGTKTVSAQTGARANVPTLSPVTGVVEK